jgi:hypothetical protein
MRGGRRLLFLAALAALFCLGPAASASAADNLHVIIEGSGAGEVITTGEEEGWPTPPIDCDYVSPGPATGVCDSKAVEFEPGAPLAALEAIAAPGSEFVGWTCEGVKCTPLNPFGQVFCATVSICLATGFAEIEVKAKFAALPEDHSLTVNQTGSGGGTTTVQCEEGSGFETCANPLTELPEGTEVRVTATPDGNSSLDSVSGTGSASACAASPCTFTITEDSSLSAEFNELAKPATLALFKGGNGAGTVTSNPAGINCGTEPCQATFEEGDTITLTAIAATGSAFAGWLGCHPIAGEVKKCTVTLDGPAVDVTAVFMAEGVQGPQGPQGNPGNTGPQGPQGNPGNTGPQGPQGNPGTPGAQGPTGADGQNGANGKDGATGPAGAQGPTGPQGERGPEGKVKVTCKVKGKKVKCTVKQVASASKLRWRLMHAGQVVDSGTTTGHRGRARLSLDGDLQTGRYVLRIDGQKGVPIAIG